MSDKNIFQRISAITAELGTIAKDMTVGEGEKAYSATSEATVLAAVKPLEEKYGVFSYAASRSLEQQIVEKTYVWNGEPRTLRLVLATVTETYRFVNVDKPDDFMETVSFGSGLDSGDKAPGKAMTYADKYALMKTYKISTGAANDPDSVPSPDAGVSFVEQNPMIPAIPQNPMVPSAPGQAKPQTAEKPPMTVEAAKQVVVPFGEYAKKTLGELLATNRGMVEFYASERFTRREKYPQLYEAAKAIMQSSGS